MPQVIVVLIRDCHPNLPTCSLKEFAIYGNAAADLRACMDGDSGKGTLTVTYRKPGWVLENVLVIQILFAWYILHLGGGAGNER